MADLSVTIEDAQPIAVVIDDAQPINVHLGEAVNIYQGGASHSHDNKAVLDATTASYTLADESKLDAIEPGAQVNEVSQSDLDGALSTKANATHTHLKADITDLDTGVQTIVAGTNVTVDSTDPSNPIVSASGGGSSTFAGLSDVDMTGAQTGDPLIYNNGVISTTPYVPPISTLDELSDVEASAPLNGQAIIYDEASGNWIAGNVTATFDDTPYLKTDGSRAIQGNLGIKNSGTTVKEYRLRTSGSNLDTEGAGADWYWSMWSGVGFTGTQYDQMIFSASGAAPNFPRGIQTSAGARLGGLTLGATRQSANYTVADGISIVFMSCTGGNRTVTLPSAWQSGNLGRIVEVRRTDGSANTLTVNTNGGDIDTAGTVTSTITIASHGYVRLAANGNGLWYIMK